VLLGVGVAGAGPAPAAVLKTTTINGATVLTNGKGLTLYWFAPDTLARSVCTGGLRAVLAAGDRLAGRRARRHR
jgi:predicted lipoprotein with Yx(FWY)xxD motif